MPVGEALRVDRLNVPGAEPNLAPPRAAAQAPGAIAPPPRRPRLDDGLRPSLAGEPGLDADERERGRVAAEALDELPHRLASDQAQELCADFPGQDEEHQLAQWLHEDRHPEVDLEPADDRDE